MGRKRSSNDTDDVIGSQGSSQQRKKPRKQPPEPWKLPDFHPMHIKPMTGGYGSRLPKDVKKPYDTFRQFFTQERLETIARYANEYAVLHRQQPLLQRARPWKDTTPREL